MPTVEIQKRTQKIKRLFSFISSLPDNDEVRSHWARYLCVLVYGFMETGTTDILYQYSKAASNMNVSNFCKVALDRSNNINSENLTQITQCFSRDWANKLSIYLQDNGRKDSLNTISTNRHRIAHGLDTGITISQVNAHFIKCVEILEFLFGLTSNHV